VQLQWIQQRENMQTCPYHNLLLTPSAVCPASHCRTRLHSIHYTWLSQSRLSFSHSVHSLLASPEQAVCWDTVKPQTVPKYITTGKKKFL